MYALQIAQRSVFLDNILGDVADAGMLDANHAIIRRWYIYRTHLHQHFILLDIVTDRKSKWFKLSAHRSV